ncbi:MAG: DNA methyltransferase [Truepera sp.]|nr:DNA methyltransferase [Truepera sp.]
MKVELDRLPETITVPRTDPIYNCHAYLTKVPIGAIQPFIETFTELGDVVVDFFAGSGMTGLAALTVGRRARLSDISVLGQHIASGYLKEVSAPELLRVADGVVQKALEAISTLYTAKRESDGAIVAMVRTVWSFTYCCPACDYEMVYFDHLDEEGKAPASCPSCDKPFVRRRWPRLDDAPVRVVVRGENGRQVEQGVSAYDRRKVYEAEKDSRIEEVPSQTIEEDREMYSRSGLGKAGMTETRRFFSARNAIALLELWRAINNVKDEAIRQKLRFAFTAILPRASKRYQWSAKRPLNAQNQTYYIAPVYYEWNVFELFERKVNAAIKAADTLFGQTALFGPLRHQGVTYDLASADRLKHLQDESIDYVFTDPPFGSNIFYSDMNLFHEAWLGKTTDYKSEAVVHTTSKRKDGSAERYENLLRDSFKEGWRILKPGKYMSVVFGNSSGRIWGLVQRALRDAGFKAAPAHVAVLDKGQRSVKGLNSGSEGVVTVDLIVTVQKPAEGENANDVLRLANGNTEELIAEAIGELSVEDAWSPSRVYARVLKKAIQRHLMLDDLHLSDVLISLRNAGYSVDHKTGLLRET